MPNGANLVNAIVASLVLCLQLVPHRRHLQRCLLDALRHLRCLPAADLHPDVPGVPQPSQERPRPRAHLHVPVQGRHDEGHAGHPPASSWSWPSSQPLVPFSAAEIGDKLPTTSPSSSCSCSSARSSASSALGAAREEYKGRPLSSQPSVSLRRPPRPRRTRAPGSGAPTLLAYQRALHRACRSRLGHSSLFGGVPKRQVC